MLGGIIMTEPNLENHKGTPCPYSRDFVFCQEGVCSGCQLYKNWQEKWKDIETKMDYKVGK